MGQRSQIYIRIKDSNNKKYSIARYYQWNYAERMLSRARSTMEWMKARAAYIGYHTDTLKSIMDVNFDYRDIVQGTDLFDEWKDCKKYNINNPNCTIKDFIFNIDNNDGRLLIDMTVTEDGGKCEIKYAFVDYDNNYIGDGSKYLKWDRFDFADLPDTVDKETIPDNLNWISENAVLMTEDETVQYIDTFCNTEKVKCRYFI